jgi:predicted ATPase
MRRAKLEDAWRRIRKGHKQWEFVISSFAYDDISGLGSGEIVFNSQVSVLAGPNGVEKTTLLKAIWASADPHDAQLGHTASLKFASGRASLRCTRKADRLSSDVEFVAGEVRSGLKMEFECFHLDPGVPQLMQRKFCSFSSVDDIINGMSVQLADEVLLEEINYVSRRDYREIKIYEIDDGDDVAPFFEVAYRDDRYDSRTMGAGELSSLFLWWAIDRAPNNSLLLVEEPETYLSPAAQEALIEFLVVSVSKKFLNVIMTSHSPNVFRRLPLESMVCLYRQGGGTKIANRPIHPEWWRTVGIEPPVDIIVLVEDLSAELLLRHILESNDPILARRLEVRQKAGQGDIVTFLRAVDQQFMAIKIIGAFDGDQKGQVPDEILVLSVFLPGEEAIETQFRSLINEDQSLLPKVTGSKDNYILAGLEGLDSHDWFHRLADGLGKSQEQLFTIIYPIWEASHDHKSQALQFVTDLVSRIEKHN